MSNELKELRGEELKADHPTPEQAMWYRFAVENRGFEWIDMITHKRFSKVQLWCKYYGNEPELNRLTGGLSTRYRKKLKVDWKVYTHPSGAEEVVSVETYKDYLRLEKKKRKRKQANSINKKAK